MGRIDVQGCLSLNDFALHHGIHAVNMPARHLLFLQIPEDVPVAVIAVFIVHGIGGISLTLSVCHA